ncbi:TPA: fibronectin type III domain-containing protein, partial [archaeon]|nr:fibronectin type III domain-containing protein [Candidatus Naiadarchaeales archaeon SRR2090153.bin1042]
MSPKGYSKIVFASFIAIFLTLSIAALAQFADYPPGAVLPGGGVAPPPPSYVEPTSQPGPIYVSPTGFITGGGPTGFQIASQPVTQQLGTCAKLPFSTLCSQTQAVDFGQEYTVSKIKFEARPGGSTPPCGATTVTFTGYGKDLIFPTIIQPVSSSAQNWGSAEISVNNLKVQRVIASVTSGCQYLDDIKVTLTPSTITTLTLTAGLTTPNSVQLSWNSYPGAVDYVPQYRSAVLPIGWADAPRVISTSTTISGLSSNTNYEFRVIAMGRILNIIPTQLAESNIVARQTLPFVFTLTAGTATATSVPLSWNSISGATEYLPQYRGAGTTSWSNAPLVTTTSTTIGGLATGNSYDFKVIAIATVFGVKIPFAESNVVPKTASAPPAADTTKPTVSVSRNPSAPKVGDKVTLSATASDASGIGELAIYYGTTATSLIKQVGTPGGSASATVTPPTP